MRRRRPRRRAERAAVAWAAAACAWGRGRWGPLDDQRAPGAARHSIASSARCSRSCDGGGRDGERNEPRLLGRLRRARGGAEGGGHWMTSALRGPLGTRLLRQPAVVGHATAAAETASGTSRGCLGGCSVRVGARKVGAIG